MTAPARTLTNVLRIALAVALSLSWLIATGLPAQAVVTRSYVKKPEPASTVDRPRLLVVVVERTVPAPEEERVWVETNLYFAGIPVPAPQGSEPPAASEDEVSSQQAEQEPKPLNGKKPYRLPFRNAEPGQGPSELLNFQETIHPYALAWAGGAVAANGRYVLQYRGVSKLGGGEPQRQEWQPFEFSISAPPPAQEAPLTVVADPAKKRTSVAWRHNAAPDVTSYKVERQRGDERWQVVKENVKPSEDGANAITDTVPKYGTYRYKVTAFRPAGNGSGEQLHTTSPPSAPLEVAAEEPSTPGDAGGDDDGAGDGDGDRTGAGDGDGTGTGDGTGSGGNSPGSGSGSNPPFPSTSGGTSSNPSFGTTTEPFSPSVASPEDFDDTYRGPLDFGVEPQSVTERVPVDIAQGGGGTSSDSTIEVLDRAIDQERVLPPVAGGLILVISAAHVLRYLNE